jgi:hypothetical protein
MPRKNTDESKLTALLDEVAQDSLKKRETKQEYKDRLEAMRELIESHIETALV